MGRRRSSYCTVEGLYGQLGRGACVIGGVDST